MSKVRINQGRIISLPFRFTGTLVVFAGSFAALLNLSQWPAISISIALGALMPVIWSSFYILEIDPKKKTIAEISWIINWKKAKITPFEEIEKIFVNESRQQQQITSWGGQMHTSRFKEYVAFLKLTSGENFYLFSATTPEDIREKINPIKTKLNCEVTENY